MPRLVGSAQCGSAISQSFVCLFVGFRIAIEPASAWTTVSQPSNTNPPTFLDSLEVRLRRFPPLPLSIQPSLAAGAPCQPGSVAEVCLTAPRARGDSASLTPAAQVEALAPGGQQHAAAYAEIVAAPAQSRNTLDQPHSIQQTVAQLPTALASRLFASHDRLLVVSSELCASYRPRLLHACRLLALLRLLSLLFRPLLSAACPRSQSC